MLIESLSVFLGAGNHNRPKIVKKNICHFWTQHDGACCGPWASGPSARVGGLRSEVRSGWGWASGLRTLSLLMTGGWSLRVRTKMYRSWPPGSADVPVGSHFGLVADGVCCGPRAQVRRSEVRYASNPLQTFVTISFQAPSEPPSSRSSEKVHGEARSGSGSLSASVSKGCVMGFGHSEPGTATVLLRC